MHIFIGVFSLAILLLMYLKFKTKRCKNYTKLVGNTVIVTGANKGIGYQSALDFARRGARVILACRNQKLANEARNRIIESTGNANIVVKYLDFSSFKTVRAFAKDFGDTEERLDILVNNIGVFDTTNGTTEDDFPINMQINYYGHILLTILLLEILKRSAPCRIVNVSSALALFGNLRANDLDKKVTSTWNKRIRGVLEYANAKLGIILFTQRLAQLLKDQRIYVFSLHPGTVKTDLLDSLSGPLKIIWKSFLNLYGKTAEEGAQTIIYAATESGIEKHTGRHFQNCKVFPTYPNARNSTKRIEIFNQTLDKLDLEEHFRRMIHQDGKI